MSVGALPQTPALIAARLDLQNTFTYANYGFVILNAPYHFVRFNATTLIHHGRIYFVN